ncbi:MAG: thioredoxin family protein [Bacteroidales bacterium]|nr:thioredoxin family protein [Bacteroidales bacterium]
MEYSQQIKQTVAALVEFYSQDNANCEAMAPVVQRVRERIGDLSAQVITIDVNADPRLADREKIETLPTFIVYRYGRAHWRATGIVSEDDLFDHLAASADPTPANELGKR